MQDNRIPFWRDSCLSEQTGKKNSEESSKGNSRKRSLSLITCGSVDDGKSTLIGRLLYETNAIEEDILEQISNPKNTANKVCANQPIPDLSQLLDGLEAERQQNITIDVAYRYFISKNKRYIIADCPGHEQYTRNMATAASNAELAVILIDASKGLLNQTYRHSCIVTMLGVKNIIFAINKMDKVDWQQKTFTDIRSQCQKMIKTLNKTLGKTISETLEYVNFIPLSALKGDNVTKKSTAMSWYHGDNLLQCLEKIDVKSKLLHQPLRLPIQLVQKMPAGKRVYSGRICSGKITLKDRICSATGQANSIVTKIFLHNKQYHQAQVGQSISCCLQDEIDISHNDIICLDNETKCRLADQFRARLLWLHHKPSFCNRRYIFQSLAGKRNASITMLREKIDIEKRQTIKAANLGLNDIGIVNLQLDSPCPFDTYSENKNTGSFILIDALDNDTLALGLIDFALWRGENIPHQKLILDQSARASLKGHRAKILWFTGISGAGKSTIANLVELELHRQSLHTILLDGDNLRHGLNCNLGFTEADRIENIRRVAHVAKLMTSAGLITLVSFISPYRAERDMARGLVGKKEFIEIFIDTPIEVAKKRDPKGLYKKALKGQIKNFTAIDSPYEEPLEPDIHIDTTLLKPEQAARIIVTECLKDLLS